MEKQRKIDIIIPIYNAYDDLQKCISSILAHTNLEHHRVLLVNDASPDPRISPYLRTLEKTNVVVLENEKNLGFSGSINRGIQVSGDRDVILLNSDTIVTKNWIEKIIACAYSDETIATVTPLSNNATLCSVPEFLKENTLPDGYTLDEYAQLIEQISLKAYPRIPVANGFCMYIKREVIKKIGVFDSATFGRGYGEENDFCYRAEQMGYKHVICDDTYIYHTGTTSFISDEKKKYIEAHEKILNARYPEQNHAVAVHCRDNPNAWIQENIRLWTKLLNNRKNILYLVQSDFRKDANDHLGGTQLHVKDMTEIMRSKYNIFVAARDVDYLNLTIYTEKEEFLFRFYIGNVPRYPEFHNKKFASLYGKILNIFRIELVHIHHTKDLTLEMYYEANKRNIPIIVTLHDYFCICPSIKLVNCCGGLCAYDKEEQCCQQCLQKKFGIQNGLNYIENWRKEYKNVLKMAQTVIVPSESAKQVVLNYNPELWEKIQVIEHGMKQMQCLKHEIAKEFHVAFVGGISTEKGSHISFKLIKNGSSDIQWFLFGTWGYNELSMLKKRNYTKTGLYERDDLPELIRKYKIDLICILPIWPETYCYTLSEAIMCNVPVIATDIGALGERLRQIKCGWLVSPQNAYEETLKILSRIKHRNKEYAEKYELTQSVVVRNLQSMGQDYIKVYEKFQNVLIQYGAVSSEDYYEIFSAYMSDCIMDGILKEGENECKERMMMLEKELKELKNSFEYKCSKALGRIPIARMILSKLYSTYIKLKRK